MHSTLKFQGKTVEGWARQFGSYVDYNNFFGSDGVYYKRIIIKRNRNRNTNKRRQIMYSYFINTQTLERSDSGAPPYIVIGGGDGDFVKAQMADKEKIFRQILDANPAFPKWKADAFVTPKNVVVHNGAAEVADDSLLQLIENGDRPAQREVERQSGQVTEFEQKKGGPQGPPCVSGGYPIPPNPQRPRWNLHFLTGVRRRTHRRAL